MSNNMDNNANTQGEQSRSPQISTSYTCNSCQISFQNGQEQRSHMKEPWHVANIKRRVESLPPIPRDEFESQEKPVEKKAEKKVVINQFTTDSRSNSDEEIEDNEEEEAISPFQCLFCNQDFESDDAGLETNIEHMRIDHGLFIPDSELVEDLQSFVAYLATEIRIWHECLYCGATKPSTSSIQSHMRDKGHCLLNFDREPELLEFWESRVDEEGTEALNQEHRAKLSATEIRFASGRVIGSRHSDSATKKASRRRIATSAKALPPGSEASEASTSAEEAGPPSQTEGTEASQLTVAPRLPSRQLARREEMSIQGISVQQRQALVSAEKKAQRSEAVARRAREWVYARSANSQKFDQLDNQMKFGKQNHKLLPR